jgi:nitroreductase
LEKRLEFPFETWSALTEELPENAFFIGLTSVHWREAWKYGERAYRYCQHDVGHAIAAISVAGAGLGWEANLLDDIGTGDIADLLGVIDPMGAEIEHPDCLIAVTPRGESRGSITLSEDTINLFRSSPWKGTPNQLSPNHVDWSIIDDVAEAAAKPRTSDTYPPYTVPHLVSSSYERDLSLRKIIHQRRSAQVMDGRTEMKRNDFYRILERTLPGPGKIPFNTLPWPASVHLLLFVHRVCDVAPGIYFLVRDRQQNKYLRSVMRKEFSWTKPADSPGDLDLYLLAEDDTRDLSRTLSCHQHIASDGSFSLGMIAEFEGSLQRYGAWFYPRIFWECGLIGQVLYLEAEAAGVRGTGIGCFFDDPVHDVLGLNSTQYQSLYHFTVGTPVEDRRLTTLPAYPGKRA